MRQFIFGDFLHPIFRYMHDCKNGVYEGSFDGHVGHVVAKYLPEGCIWGNLTLLQQKWVSLGWAYFWNLTREYDRVVVVPELGEGLTVDFIGFQGKSLQVLVVETRDAPAPRRSREALLLAKAKLAETYPGKTIQFMRVIVETTSSGRITQAWREMSLDTM
jgi:hypothetical protein